MSLRSLGRHFSDIILSLDQHKALKLQMFVHKNVVPFSGTAHGGMADGDALTRNVQASGNRIKDLSD